MIVLDKISVMRDGRKILDNVSLSIDEGDCIAVIGSNGAGKSTLFDVIAGRIQPTEGTVLIDRVDVTQHQEIERAPMIARLCQNPRQNIVDSMSVAENMVLAGLKGRSARLRLVSQQDALKRASLVLQHLLGRCDLSLCKKRMDQLSGGQCQTVALAMAMTHAPKVLLLDEPTAALDPHSATLVLKKTLEHVSKHNLTTLVITHDMNIAKDVGNKLIVLREGKIVEQLDVRKNNVPLQSITELLH